MTWITITKIRARLKIILGDKWQDLHKQVGWEQKFK